MFKLSFPTLGFPKQFKRTLLCGTECEKFKALQRIGFYPHFRFEHLCDKVVSPPASEEVVPAANEVPTVKCRANMQCSQDFEMLSKHAVLTTVFFPRMEAVVSLGAERLARAVPKLHAVDAK